MQVLRPLSSIFRGVGQVVASPFRSIVVQLEIGRGTIDFAIHLRFGSPTKLVTFLVVDFASALVPLGNRVSQL